MHKLANIINAAYEMRLTLSPETVDASTLAAIDEVVQALDAGRLRIAEKIDGAWQTHAWLKKAVLLYFRTHENVRFDAGFTQFYDKVPLKYADYDESLFKQSGVRVVPHALIRKGAF
ncbi:MAG TPA: 2,3,4,5-tetrahydropyridine-2,6-dicarboxylate N-succinyltransferase, partial [Myxococcota bacterium]|nr:2,3,4,5-tetrahydropyridine-2,6-dicarboxylate N-succinyltransferase [Myxococcota bacterium]